MRRKRVVLLVHPDDTSRVTFQVVLKREGYGVLEASSAAEALEQLGEVQPDLLIADIRASRKSSIELIRTIRSQDRYRQMRILALAGKSSTVAPPEGIDEVHAGPITAEQLVKKVAGMIGRA